MGIVYFSGIAVLHTKKKTTMKAILTGIPETLFITLRIRVAETKKPNGAIKDPDAVNILNQIEFNESNKNKVSKISQTGVITRTIILDGVIAEFLANNPQGIIVNLGCGLDARCKRLSPQAFQWFDIDVAESIDLRKHFFEETPTYHMIAKSMFDYSWMNNIPKNHPLLFLAEGVMMYFEEKDIRALFTKIAETFLSAEIAFNTLGKWMARNHKKHPDVKKYNAPFKWGIDNAQSIEEWKQGFKLIKIYYHIDYLTKRWPLFFRMMPFIRKSMKVIHMKLSSAQ